MGTTKQAIRAAKNTIGEYHFNRICYEITCSIVAGVTKKPGDAYNAFAFNGVYGLEVFRIITHFWPSLG